MQHKPEVEKAFEHQLHIDAKKANIPGEPYLDKDQEGKYKRSDIQTAFIYFRKGWYAHSNYQSDLEEF